MPPDLNMMENRTVYKGKSDRSNTPEDRCYLLELARELRDMVYEYTLTEDGGLVAYISNGLTRFRASSNSQDLESNQLQYTCHQLRAETKCLSIRFNDLTFIQTPEGIAIRWTTHTTHQDSIEKENSTAHVLFCNFLSTCSASHQSRIRKVTLINPNYLFGATSFAPLIQFCLDHPGTTVIVRSDNLDESERFPDPIQRFYEQCKYWDMGIFDLSVRGSFALPELPQLAECEILRFPYSVFCPMNLRFGFYPRLSHHDAQKIILDAENRGVLDTKEEAHVALLMHFDEIGF